VVLQPPLLNEISQDTRLLPVPTCTIDSALIYTMVVKILNTIWPPPPQISLLGGQRWEPVLLAHSLRIKGRAGEDSLHNLRMSMPLLYTLFYMALCSSVVQFVLVGQRKGFLDTSVGMYVPNHLPRTVIVILRFCYAAYNSRKFNGFNNSTFWSISVVITGTL
jgi:hypothetical protein